MSEPPLEGIPLSEMIVALRRELAIAHRERDASVVALAVEELEIELEVSVTRTTGGGGGVKFWVVTGEAKHEKKGTNRQKLKVKLGAADASGGQLAVSQERPERPDFEK